MCRPILTLLAALSLLLASPIQATDLHRLWDDRCIECHDHAAAFARKHLTVVDGSLQGRHADRDLRLFLGNHFLDTSEVDAVYGMLLAQASTTPRFKEQCSACHQDAAQFARDSLVWRNQALYGRSTDRTVSDFLRQHRKLSAEDAAFFATLLERVAREVALPDG